MNIAHPEVLWLLIPFAALAFWLFARERSERAQRRFLSPLMYQRLAEGDGRRTNLVLGLRLLTCALLILTLAGPQWGQELSKVERMSLDIFFVVDCSPSMAARDLVPNRMDAAKRELHQLVGELQGNRLGLLGFAGRAFLFCPLTVDQSATQLFLKQLDQDAVQIPGTAIGDAIRLALASLPPNEGQAQILVVLTDGEDHHSEPLKAAEEAAAKGVIVHTVGIGTLDGAPIPYRRGFVKDSQGKTVISKMDRETLVQIAQKTGGEFALADGTLDPLKPILSAIEGAERQQLEAQMVVRYQDRFQIFLGLALLCLVLAQVLEFRIQEAA